MSKLDFLHILNSYRVEEFIEFLNNNGLGEFEALALRKKIDGNTFLNLAHFEINNWRPLISTHQTNKFCFFLQQVKRSPEKFVFVTRTKAVVSPITSPSNKNAQKPSQNADFLNSLRTAIESHVGGRKVETKDSNSDSQTQSRLVNRAPLLRSPEFHCLVSGACIDKPVYEQPRGQNVHGFNKNRSLPEILRTLPPLSPTNKHGPLRKLPSAPISSGEINQIYPKFQPIGLEDYYGKRKEMGVDLTRSITQSFNRVFQSDTTPNFQTSSTNTEGIYTFPRCLCRCFLPKPPKSFPKIDSLVSPDSLNPPPIETQNYHRHTDWEGAEELLISSKIENGTYIIRPSKTYGLALSVRQGDKVYHIGVKRIEDGMFEAMSAGLELKFVSLSEMIAYFKMHPISIRNKQSGIIDIYLNKALPLHERNT